MVSVAGTIKFRSLRQVYDERSSPTIANFLELFAWRPYRYDRLPIFLVCTNNVELRLKYMYWLRVSCDDKEIAFLQSFLKSNINYFASLLRNYLILHFFQRESYPNLWYKVLTKLSTVYSLFELGMSPEIPNLNRDNVERNSLEMKQVSNLSYRHCITTCSSPFICELINTESERNAKGSFWSRLSVHWNLLLSLGWEIYQRC